MMRTATSTARNGHRVSMEVRLPAALPTPGSPRVPLIIPVPLTMPVPLITPVPFTMPVPLTMPVPFTAPLPLMRPRSAILDSTGPAVTASAGGDGSSGASSSSGVGGSGSIGGPRSGSAASGFSTSNSTPHLGHLDAPGATRPPHSGHSSSSSSVITGTPHRGHLAMPASRFMPHDGHERTASGRPTTGMSAALKSSFAWAAWSLCMRRFSMTLSSSRLVITVSRRVEQNGHLSASGETLLPHSGQYTDSVFKPQTPLG